MRHWIAPITLGIVMLLAVMGTLWGMGAIALPFLGRREMIPPPIPQETVRAQGGERVYLTTRPLKAYSRITAEMLMEPESFRFRTLPAEYFTPEEGEPVILIGLEPLVGRVLKQDKAANKAFTEDDFLPKGTREGKVAGFPADRRAVVVDAATIPGLHGLRREDRIDLVTTNDKGQLVVLAGDVIIVEPVSPRPILNADGKMVEEATLAVSATQVERVLSAISKSEKFFAVALSGRGEEAAAYPTPPPPPPPQPAAPKPTPTPMQAIVEKMVGKDRELVRFFDQKEWEQKVNENFKGKTQLEAPAAEGQ